MKITEKENCELCKIKLNRFSMYWSLIHFGFESLSVCEECNLNLTEQIWDNLNNLNMTEQVCKTLF